MSSSKILETLVLVHRYLYYVRGTPIIADHVYDNLERKARESLPLSSPVHKIGSDLKKDYSPGIIATAERFYRAEHE